MKATGIVRRMDDLGRVVIPKEIRKTMGIREGDQLELFTKDDCIIFKRYNPYDMEQWDMALAVAEALCGKKVVLLDRDKERVCGSLKDSTEWRCREIRESCDDDLIGFVAVNETVTEEVLEATAKAVSAVMNM